MKDPDDEKQAEEIEKISYEMRARQSLDLIEQAFEAGVDNISAYSREESELLAILGILKQREVTATQIRLDRIKREIAEGTVPSFPNRLHVLLPKTWPNPEDQAIVDQYNRFGEDSDDPA